MSSVNSTSSSTSSNTLRITGMATGMDTDATVKQMMAAENAKLDKLKQNRQYNEWKQEALRDVIKDFRGLRDDYLLSTSASSTNMIKSANYSTATVTTSGTNADAVTATALPGAVTGTSTITVNKIAKTAKIDGSRIGTNTTNVVTGNYDNWDNKTIKFSVNSGTTDISIGVGDVTSESDLVDKLNAAINGKDELKGKVRASLTSDNKIMFSVLTSDSVKITDDASISELGVLKGKELNPTTSTKLSYIDSSFGTTDTKSFYIKQGSKVSSEIKITGDFTIQQVIDEINKANAKSGDTSSSLNSDLKIGFSDLTKSLTIQTRNVGSAQSLQIVANSDGTGTIDLNSILGLGAMNSAQTGQDAEVSIKPVGATTGTTVRKSSNNFTIDNITYNLIKDPVDANGNPQSYDVTLTTKSDSQASVDKIKAFIEKYNALVEKINTKLTEKKNNNYSPLTDSQKESMETADITAWETKVKKGILRNDNELQSILYNMRTAFTSGVTTAGLTLQEIGLDTYSGSEAITKPGQIKIEDESKLKTALEERGDQVMKLFTVSEPTTVPSKPSTFTGTDDEWSQKYKYDNTGILKRIESIIYNSASKADGTLLQRAGYENTVSQYTNTLTKQLAAQDKVIDEMKDKIYDKQEQYYQKFAKLEAAMNTLNSQQSWLTQSLSG